MRPESADDDMIAQRLDLMAHVFDAKSLLDPRDGDELHKGAHEKDQANLQNGRRETRVPSSRVPSVH